MSVNKIQSDLALAIQAAFVARSGMIYTITDERALELSGALMDQFSGMIEEATAVLTTAPVSVRAAYSHLPFGVRPVRGNV